MMDRILKRILIGMPLGCLGSLLSTFALPLLVIVLCVSLIGDAFPFGTTSPDGSSTNAGQTHEFTGNQNDAVVNAARFLARTLYSCGNAHYKCYTANFPANVLHYLNDACGNPQCPYAQSGDFQCVFFVLGVYYLAGQTLPLGPDAVKFWQAYQNVAGWLEIPANGMPKPGDMAVFSGPASGPNANPFGHIAVIIDVAEPGKTAGYIQLAQANALAAVENLPLLKTNPSQDHPIWQVGAWSGYNLLGYIRNAANG